MSENETGKKKTLSLKLGSKPIIKTKRNIEAGKTVIVEKKRFKRSSSQDHQVQKPKINKALPENKVNLGDNLNKLASNKSGVLLKPLSKDEQKKNTKSK